MNDTVSDDTIEAVLVVAGITTIDNLRLLRDDVREERYSLESLRTAAEKRLGTRVKAIPLADAAARIEARKGFAIVDYLRGVFQ